MELEFSGEELIGCEYTPPFNFFDDIKTKSLNAFKIHHGDFVSEEDGTGFVHVAPGFGEEDSILCKTLEISTVCPVDEGGNFTQEVYHSDINLVDRNVFETNDDIVMYLKKNNLCVKVSQHEHNYPHCWRTDTKLIYKAIPSWYVKVTDIKDRMLHHNQKINWIPENVKDGLFGKWLENARDWSISRNRFWGCPIPVWESNDPKYPRIDVYGSIAELTADFREYYLNDSKNSKFYINQKGEFEINNLHRPYIDELIRLNPNDPRSDKNHPDHNNCSKMIRCTDILDCWFESGAMPFASIHYPFENQEWFKNHFPADFIVEYAAQTRGWFYTLTVLAVALFDSPAFLNCICHGVILDENGNKLSKRLKNYPDPKEIFNTYGSDAMRWLMLRSSIMHGNEMRIDKEGESIKDIVRLFLNGIKNSLSFLKQYQEIDKLPLQLINNSTNKMDEYLLISLRDFSEKFSKWMDEYNTPKACIEAENFLDTMNNWYIRRNKGRFWQSENGQDKQQAFNTLYTVLYYYSIILSPLLPCLTEEIFQNLEELRGLK